MINYTLKQLYSFEAVVRLGGFTSASKELHITQPAVYMQVQQLQRILEQNYLMLMEKQLLLPLLVRRFLKLQYELLML